MHASTWGGQRTTLGSVHSFHLYMGFHGLNSGDQACVPSVLIQWPTMNKEESRAICHSIHTADSGPPGRAWMSKVTVKMPS